MTDPVPLSTPLPAPLAAWHAIAEARDPAGLADLLAADCVFRSPAVHRPQEGATLTAAYLRAALVVLGATLRYVEQWVTGDDEAGSAVLEFTATVGGREVHGIDLLRWDGGRLTSFTVMIRPMKGLEAVIGAMGAELAG